MRIPLQLPRALAVGLAMLGSLLQPMLVPAATVALDGSNTIFSGVTLQSVTLDGQTFTTGDMVQITMTAFAGATSGALVVQNTGLSPGNNYTISAADRRALIETDWRGDTGLINPSTTAGSFQASFNQPVVNRTGVDMILFEINSTTADGFFLTINSQTVEIFGSAFGTTTATTNSADTLNVFDSGNNNTITPSTLSQLLNNPVRISGNNIAQDVHGVGIDFSDFGVGLGDSVTSFSLHSNSGSATVDPVIIAGIIPEPSTGLLLGGAAVLGLGARRRRR